MAGYVRQSAADILAGEPVAAGPLNAEFDQLVSAFSGTTGHTHSGGTGDGPQLSLTTAVTGYLPAANGGVAGRNNVSATTAPSVSNDSSQGYSPGSRWIDVTADRAYVCVDASVGAAIWSREVVVNAAGTSVNVGAILANVTTPVSNTDAATKAYVDSAAFTSALPGQAGNAGKFVTTDGTNASWANLPSASESAAGVIEIATSAEVQAGTDSIRAVVPSTLVTLTSTESRAGIAEIATQTETNTGTDDARFVTPLKLTTRFTTTINMQDATLQRPVFRDYGETVNTITASSATTYDVDLTLGNVVELAHSANITLTFSNPSASGVSCSFTIIRTKDNSGTTRSITFPASVKWGGPAPTITQTANAKDIFVFTTTDAGSNWLGRAILNAGA